MSDEYNIAGLEPDDARNYIVAVMTTLKQTSARRIELEQERDAWSGRAKLATEKGRADLAEAAQGRITGLEDQIGKLKVEEEEYRDGIRRMMVQLKELETKPKMSVDADLLVAQMEILLGDKAATDEKFRTAEADWALEELKKRMNPNSSGTPNEPQTPPS